MARYFINFSSEVIGHIVGSVPGGQTSKHDGSNNGCAICTCDGELLDVLIDVLFDVVLDVLLDKLLDELLDALLDALLDVDEDFLLFLFNGHALCVVRKCVNDPHLHVPALLTGGGGATADDDGGCELDVPTIRAAPAAIRCAGCFALSPMSIRY